MLDNSPALRVLVADGSADSAESLRVLLHVWGCDARAVTSPRDARTLARTFRPQVVIADLAQLDGKETAFAVRMRRASGHGDVLLIATAVRTADGCDRT